MVFETVNINELRNFEACQYFLNGSPISYLKTCSLGVLLHVNKFKP